MDDKKLDVRKLLIDLNTELDQDFTQLEDDELDAELTKIVYSIEKLTFNIVDWSLDNLHLISPEGLKAVLDIRTGNTVMTNESLCKIDPISVLVKDVVTKLDLLDTSKRMADVLLKVMSI